MWLGKHQLSQFDGISLDEARRRVLGTMVDYIRHIRERKKSGGKIHLAFLDETSLQLEPAQRSKLIVAELNSGIRLPLKGTLRGISVCPTIHNVHPSEGLVLPLLINLGDNSTKNWEKSAVGAIYGASYVSRARGQLVVSEDRQFAFLFHGSCRTGGTHLNASTFLLYVHLLMSSFRSWKSQGVGRAHDQLVIGMDNCPAHSVEDLSVGSDGRELGKQSSSVGRKFSSYLSDQGVSLFRLRSRMTSHLCPLDKLVFRSLKQVVASSWRSGLSSMLSHETYRKLSGLQLEYGVDSFFFSYGFDPSGDRVMYDWLATTVKELIPEDEYESKMVESAFSATWESKREQDAARPKRRAKSAITLPTNEWQRPHKLLGYNRRVQEATFARMYGHRIRSGSVNDAAEDIEVE